MTAPLKLVVFDVDGTLVDSQNDIVAGMSHAFGLMNLPGPSRAEVLATVGLSLPSAMAQLAPTADDDTQAHLVAAYKKTYRELRIGAGSRESSPLYDGITQVLAQLHAVPPLLMGIATGKSRRGLDILLDAHELRPYFVTQHCEDDHPSKPHPSMVSAAMGDAGVEPADTVVIGDTSFDMEMARAAGAGFIGVSWGYHDRARLAGADAVVDTPEDLIDAVLSWGRFQ